MARIKRYEEDKFIKESYLAFLDTPFNWISQRYWSLESFLTPL
ncbi:hypothetical protein ACQCVP_01875 [Rossellomorea vietnamensis]